MSDAYENQLARSDELPPTPEVMSLLSQQSDGDTETALYERFRWEIQRDKQPKQALDLARFALSYAPIEQPDLKESIAALNERIHRSPQQLEAGQHLPLDEQLQVVNLSEKPVQISSSEILLAKEQLSPDKALTVVIDDHETSARQNDKQLVWNLASQADDSLQGWSALWAASGGKGQLPAWIEALSNGRHPVDINALPSEHQVRAQRTREFVSEMLLNYAYGPAGDQLEQLEEEEVIWVLDQIDHFFDHYTQSPRLALNCLSLDDFSPAIPWQQHGPAATAALIASVTGDDPLLVNVLQAAGRLRIGNLAFTGDPDNNGDDLLSAVLPPQACSAVLRPEVLPRTLFFAGMPYPGADLPVPQRRHGAYNTLAFGDEVCQMLRTRSYLGLTPAAADSVQDYFQGRAQEIRLEETTGNPAFQALVTAVMIRRRQGEGNPMVRAAVRVAAAHSVYVGLSRDPSKEAIGGVHLGALELSDIEQVIVPLADGDEWRQYHKSGKLPSRLRSQAKFLHGFDIQLRGRAPVGHGSMAVGS